MAEILTRQPNMRSLQIEGVLVAIADLKQSLMAKGEATELFAQKRGEGLNSALATIEQGFAGCKKLA